MEGNKIKDVRLYLNPKIDRDVELYRILDSKKNKSEFIKESLSKVLLDNKQVTKDNTDIVQALNNISNALSNLKILAPSVGDVVEDEIIEEVEEDLDFSDLDF